LKMRIQFETKEKKEGCKFKLGNLGGTNTTNQKTKGIRKVHLLTSASLRERTEKRVSQEMRP